MITAPKPRPEGGSCTLSNGVRLGIVRTPGGIPQIQTVARVASEPVHTFAADSHPFDCPACLAERAKKSGAGSETAVGSEHMGVA